MIALAWPTERAPRVHFSGIGGTAMVAGARLALEAGWEVRGSDNPLYPPTSDMVRDLGVPIAASYNAANLDWGPDLVLLGNVLSRGNPEVEAVLERRMPYASLPEWLKEVVLRKRRPVAVCGTHGKTTTTTLTAHLLDAAGLQPGYLIGGKPVGFPHSARLGPEGAPFVIEGDEYDTAFFDKRAKFFHYIPEVAVVTSIEFDHGDIYRDINEIELAFQRMLRQLPRAGRLAVCGDDPRARALEGHAFCPVITYGFSPDCAFRAEDAGGQGGYRTLTVFKERAEWGTFEVPLAGRHNLQNALAALAVCDAFGLPPEALREGLRTFPGVRRRMEVFLVANGVTFVDDFAHHPTAIQKTIEAARERWPEGHLHVLFEPRSNTVVTNRFQEDLRTAFRSAGSLWIGPIYRADRIPEAERLDRGTLARALAEEGIRARVADDTKTIVAGILEEAREGDTVLILSNGAFGGIYDDFRQAAMP